MQGNTSAIRATLGQSARFIAVSLASNLLLYLCYATLSYYGMGHKTAMTLLYTMGVLQTFYANKAWTFKSTKRGEFSRYLQVYALGYIINFFALYLAVDIYGYSHLIIQAIMLFIVGAVVFGLQKFWVFSPNSAHTGTEINDRDQ
jgi:putative flippase GtrA